MATSPNPFDQFDAPIVSQQVPLQANPFDQFDEKPKAPTMMDQVGRQLGLAGRSIVQGIVGLPAMAADVGVATANLVHNLRQGISPTLADFNPFAKTGGTPQTYEMPSHSFNQALTSVGVPEPKTLGEKAANIVESGLMGSRMPVPQAAEQAPSNFMTPEQMESQTLANITRKGQDAGLVVPPATANRTPTNVTLETIAGKIATQQASSAHNQPVINQLAKEAIGLNPDTPLTQEGLSALRQEASATGYEPIRAAGTVVAPPSLHERLVNVLSKYQGAERSFPGMGKTDLADLVSKVDQPQFDAGDALDVTRILRDKADVAFRAGDRGTGQGIREISNAVEGALEDGLAAKGPQYQGAVDAFRNARQTIAKTYTIEEAMNPASGNIVAAKLAAALKKGTPLMGPLKDAAQFASAFPKAVGEPTHSLGVNHLDVYAPLMSALMGEGWLQKGAGLVVPLGRLGARGYLLSPLGQAGALPSMAVPATGAIPSAALGARQALQ